MKSIGLLTRLRVVVDTNVFVSAFIWGGNPRKVIQKWLREEFVLLLSPFLLAEIILVLKRFGFDQADQQRLRYILENNSLKFFPKRKVHLCSDEKNNQVLDLCLAGRADYLITGDKELLAIKDFQGTKIVSVKEFLVSRKKDKDVSVSET